MVALIRSANGVRPPYGYGEGHVLLALVTLTDPVAVRVNVPTVTLAATLYDPKELIVT